MSRRYWAELRLTVDVSARHIAPPVPGFGDVGMSFVLMLEGDPATLYLRDGFTLNAGVYNVGEGVYVYESTRMYDDGSYWTATTGNRSFTENVVYIWYEAANGCIYYNDHPGQQGAVQICGVGSLSSATEGYIGFLAYNFGSVPSFGGSSLWCDDICLRYGRVLGEAVGACYVGDACVQTIETSCLGSWQAGPCDEGCEGDIDDDGNVGFYEVLAILAAWGNAGGPEDVDGDGTVGFGDVLLVLALWGPCP